MKTMFKILSRLRHDERGVAAMEYGMIGASTIVAIAGLMSGIHGKLTAIFSTVSTSL